MTFEMFKKRLDAVKKDYQQIEEKTDSLIKGLDAFISDAAGVPQTWLLEIVENELKNLMYATIDNELIDGENSIQDFIDYYLYDGSSFSGEISWESDDGTKFHYDLSKDEDVYTFIRQGL